MKHIREYDEYLKEGFSSKGDLNKIRKALSKGKTVTASHARFPASFTVVEVSPSGMFAKVDYNDGKGPEEMAAMNIDPRSITIKESINENRNARRFQNKGKLGYNDQFSGNVSLSLTIGNEVGFGPKKKYGEGIGFDNVSMYDAKSSKTILDDALTGKYTFDDLVKIAKDWYKKNESSNGMNEAYKLGDGWSKEFDYIGMLEMGAKAKASMGEKKLQSLFNSFEDVNYHSEASPLSYAIDELKDGNKAEANRLMKEFNKNCEDTLKKLK